ncbi:hypothetical protein O6H91_03G071900 [Diphasiastrum complanatum]|uniref:Uncharacterized protein n=1 Tax=Diphasiastrum complanatum TaxID=34168 RepID=A0ACC2E800_DIPCM|nr:hypothetical protein O6H91_03G071900 [Diphasiastrum complanatum]
MVNPEKLKAEASSKNTVLDESSDSKGSNGDRKQIKGKGKHAVLGKSEPPSCIVKSVGDSHAPAALPEDPENKWPLPGKSSSRSNVAVRGVSRMRSFFDLAGTSTCSAGFKDGSGIAGKSGTVVLQIPSSSIPIPLSASAMTVSVHSNSSAAFFQTLAPRVSGVGDALSQGSGCGPCILADHCSALDLSVDRGNREADGASTILHGSAVEEAGSGRPSGVSGCTTTVDMLLFGMEEQNGMMKWLQALDFQAVGACRADERLRPLLRWNVSCFGADGRLLARLGLHFKAKELSSLARCLCTPLVSLRVGKIVRHGLILQPTSTRGFLRLSMLPCSELQLCFKGDNGSVETLGTATPGNEAFPLVLEEIGADPSRRSFTLKRNSRELAYFWHSEKSKVAGDELVSKMKNLLACRPTLAQLTGIQESRLDFLASYLPAALQTPCSTSLEVPQASSVAVNPPTRTSVSAVIPHASSSGQSFPPTQDLLNRFSGSGKLLVNLSEKFSECGELSGSTISAIPSTQHSSRSFLNDNVAGNNWNTSWSTRTSICFGSNGKTESSSNGVSNCSSSPSTSLGIGQSSRNWNNFEPAMDQLCLPLLSSPQTLFPFPSLISEPPSNACTFLPPLSTRLPISSPSLLAPYYCPCPLGGVSALHYTFSPPCLPTVGSEGELRPTSSFFSVGTSIPAFPPVPLELHQLQYSFPLPVSPSATAGLGMQSSGVSSFFGAPITHFPVVSLHVPTQGYLVQALPVVSNLGKSPVVPDYFQDIFTCHADLQVKGHDRSFSSSSMGGRSWGTRAVVQGHVTESDPLLVSNIIRNSSALIPEARVTAMNTQIREGISFSKFNTSKLSRDAGMPNIDDETQRDAIENMLKFNLPSLHSVPVLDMVPRVLSSSSLSRIIVCLTQYPLHFDQWGSFYD